VTSARQFQHTRWRNSTFAPSTDPAESPWGAELGKRVLNLHSFPVLSTSLPTLRSVIPFPGIFSIGPRGVQETYLALNSDPTYQKQRCPRRSSRTTCDRIFHLHFVLVPYLHRSLHATSPSALPQAHVFDGVQIPLFRLMRPNCRVVEQVGCWLAPSVLLVLFRLEHLHILTIIRSCPSLALDRP
jgi:hypothetical protein